MSNDNAPSAEHDVLAALDDLGIQYERFEHPPVFTVEEANLHRGDIPCGKTKNLFLRNKKGRRHYLVVTEAEKKVDLRSLKERVGESALSFASPERLQRYLGLTPGSVSPFGIINDIKDEVMVLLDRDLLRHTALGFHPNVNTATLVIQTEDFQRFLDHCGNVVRILRF